MVKGLIDTRQILSHPITISRLFGFNFYLRCLYEIITNHKDHTFLSLLRDERNKEKISSKTK